MIWSSFTLAVGQMGDPRFRRVLFLGIALTIALLFGVYALFLWGLDTFTPETLELPWIGPVGGVHTLLGFGSALVMMVLSVFLMVPVASAFSGFFLEDVARAVEERHYPSLPPVPRQGLMDMLIDNANFFGLIIAVNAIGLVFYIFAGPFAPLVFWAVNGFLLGREYFTLAAMRRIGRPAAKALRKQHFWTIWGAGILMAAPLSVPLVNLLVPVLGAATFTHIFHALTGARPVTASGRPGFPGSPR